MATIFDNIPYVSMGQVLSGIASTINDVNKQRAQREALKKDAEHKRQMFEYTKTKDTRDFEEGQTRWGAENIHKANTLEQQRDIADKNYQLAKEKNEIDRLKAKADGAGGFSKSQYQDFVTRYTQDELAKGIPLARAERNAMDAWFSGRPAAVRTVDPMSGETIISNVPGGPMFNKTTPSIAPARKVIERTPQPSTGLQTNRGVYDYIKDNTGYSGAVSSLQNVASSISGGAIPQNEAKTEANVILAAAKDSVARSFMQGNKFTIGERELIDKTLGNLSPGTFTTEDQLKTRFKAVDKLLTQWRNNSEQALNSYYLNNEERKNQADRIISIDDARRTLFGVEPGQAFSPNGSRDQNLKKQAEEIYKKYGL